MCMICFVDCSPGFMMMRLGSFTLRMIHGPVHFGWSGVDAGALSITKTNTRNGTVKPLVIGLLLSSLCHYDVVFDGHVSVA